MLLRNRIARGVAAGALVLAVPLLAGCGDFATDKVYTPAPGANDRAGDVDVLNAVIVATQDGRGTFVATFSNNLDANVVNDFDDVSDTLESISGDFTATMPGSEPPAPRNQQNDEQNAEEQAADEQAEPQNEEAATTDEEVDPINEEVAPIAEPIVITPSAKFALGTNGDAPGIPVDGDFTIGDFVEVTLTFANAGDVVVQVPVVCNANHWAGEDTNPASEGADLAPQCVTLEGGEKAEGDH